MKIHTIFFFYSLLLCSASLLVLSQPCSSPVECYSNAVEILKEDRSEIRRCNSKIEELQRNFIQLVNDKINQVKLSFEEQLKTLKQKNNELKSEIQSINEKNIPAYAVWNSLGEKNSEDRPAVVWDSQRLGDTTYFERSIDNTRIFIKVPGIYRVDVLLLAVGKMCPLIYIDDQNIVDIYGSAGDKESSTSSFSYLFQAEKNTSVSIRLQGGCKGLALGPYISKNFLTLQKIN